MSIQLQAGCRVGDCYPDGLAAVDVFGGVDVPAFIYLAGLYADRDTLCRAIDTELTDVDCSGELDEEDLTDDQYDRLGRMRAIKWTKTTVGFVAEADGMRLSVELDQTLGVVCARAGRNGPIIAADIKQAQARLAAVAYPAEVVA